jgi:hypothetical protein
LSLFRGELVEAVFQIHPTDLETIDLGLDLRGPLTAQMGFVSKKEREGHRDCAETEEQKFQVANSLNQIHDPSLRLYVGLNVALGRTQSGVTSQHLHCF